jgi:hypothetical protein
MYYYDTKGITHPSENNVRVWYKQILTKDSIYLIALMELNCVDKMYKNLEITAYSEDGLVLKSLNYYDEPYGTSIAPDSMPNVLYKLLCK